MKYKAVLISFYNEQLKCKNDQNRVKVKNTKTLFGLIRNGPNRIGSFISKTKNCPMLSLGYYVWWKFGKLNRYRNTAGQIRNEYKKNERYL